MNKKRSPINSGTHFSLAEEKNQVHCCPPIGVHESLNADTHAFVKGKIFMKVCTQCRISFNDGYMACPKCGNANLQYYAENGPMLVGQPVAPKKIFFGEFFKAYFKSPEYAKTILVQHRDYGSGLILNGITVALYFFFSICIQLGMTIRYHVSFSALLSFVYPLLFFVIIFGYQFLNVFLYALYKTHSTLPASQIALTSYIHCSASWIFPAMILALASFLSLISPGLGMLLLLIPLAIILGAGAVGKVVCGAKPSSLLDSFMFVLTGFVSYLLTYLSMALFLYIYAQMAVESMLFDIFM